MGSALVPAMTATCPRVSIASRQQLDSATLPSRKPVFTQPDTAAFVPPRPPCETALSAAFSERASPVQARTQSSFHSLSFIGVGRAHRWVLCHALTCSAMALWKARLMPLSLGCDQMDVWDGRQKTMTLLSRKYCRPRYDQREACPSRKSMTCSPSGPP